MESLGTAAKPLASGRTKLASVVRASNAAARALYETFGFRHAGMRRGYYHDNQEDAVIMWRVVEGGADGHEWVADDERVARRGGA